MKRREFLQQTGLALATLGLYETGLGCLSERYFQALAQSSPRKLALLIGINQYLTVGEIRVPALQGCLTDVDLQRELLLYRFGFQPADILTLTDKAATRQAIETAFLTHLTQQAQPGDTVVVHFSGYGSQIQASSLSDTWQNILMPVDSILSTDTGLISNGLLEDTVLLLLRSLRTDRVITILDTSYTTTQDSDLGFLGNQRVRSRPRLSPMSFNPDALVFQEQLRTQLLSEKQARKQSQQIPGIILSASGLGKDSAQVTSPASRGSALEAQWSGFSAGLWTYALTRHLWTAMPLTPWHISFNQAAIDIQQRVGLAQQPQLSSQNLESWSLKDAFLTINGSGADGVVIGVEEESRVARIWLAGLPAIVLEHYGANSLLTLLPATVLQPETPMASDAATANRPDLPQLQVSGRDGLIAKAKLYASGQPNTSEPSPSLQVGQLVREAVRVVPRNLGLTIALDPNLERIERVDATSAFATVPHVKAIVALDQAADCVFGRLTNPVRIATALSPTEALGHSDSMTVRVGDIAPPSRYGLFSMNRELIASTGDEKVKAIKLAVQRLVPQIRSLLAAKLLHLITNEIRSMMKVKAVLKTVTSTSSQVLAQRSTHNADITQLPSTMSQDTETSNQGIVSIPVGSRVSYQITNEGDRPLYLLLVSLDSLSNLLVFTPNQIAANAGESQTPLIPAIITPREVPALPSPAISFEWSIREPVGTTTTQMIISYLPFTQTLSTLRNSSSRATQELTTPPNPVEVVSALLQDLHQASLAPGSANVTGETYTLNVAAWATLSFTYQVV